MTSSNRPPRHDSARPPEWSRDLIGESAWITELRAQVDRLLEVGTGTRRAPPPVLLLGETGTGKTLLAGSMHRRSARGSGPFIAVNCAAIPETIVEAELFGFEPGAFTDARHAKPGLFQAAHEGTLFLDEIGCLSLPLQAKLLKAIDERTVRPLGSTREAKIDVWIVAATSEDPASMVRERRFRQDLYYRLATIVLEMPALRDRGAVDIILLAEHFLAETCRRYDLPPKRLDDGARSVLIEYSWPGNVRELANLIERVTLLGRGSQIRVDELGLPSSDARRGSSDPGPRTRRGLVDDFDRTQLLAALESAGGSLSRAATLLGIPRNTLRYRLEKLGLRERRSAEQPASPSTGGPSIPSSESEALARDAVGASAGSTPRQLVLLGVYSFSPPTQVVTTDSLALIMNKIRAFGGLLEDVAANAVIAVYDDDSPDRGAERALHAALAVLKTGAPGSLAQVGAILHIAECETAQYNGRAGLWPAGRAPVLSVLQDLARSVRAGAVLVTAAAAQLLENRLGLWEVLSEPPPQSGPLQASIFISPVSRRPSLAVLPFQDLSEMRDDGYLAAGVTAEVVGALSRFRWLSVVASESMLMYQTQPADLRVVGAELRVRYLLTGTLQRVTRHVRVRAELVDVDEGSIVWSEAFERPLGELFEIQEQLSARIVAAMEVRLHQAEVKRALRKRPESLDAYDCVLRFHSLVYRFTEEAFRLAGDYLEQAVALDPGYSVAYAWRAMWYLFKVYQGWSSNPDGEIAEAARMATIALELDPEDPVALALCGHTSALLLHDYNTALSHFERALTLNPNSAFAWGLSSATLCYIGEPRAALQRATYALELSPFDPFAFYFMGAIGFAHMLLDDYDEALVWLTRSRALNPRFSATLRVLAACLAHLNRLDQARAVALEFRAIEQHFSLEAFRHRWALRDALVLEAHVEDLRRAGLADDTQSPS